MTKTVVVSKDNTTALFDRLDKLENKVHRMTYAKKESFLRRWKIKKFYVSSSDKPYCSAWLKNIDDHIMIVFSRIEDDYRDALLRNEISMSVMEEFLTGLNDVIKKVNAKTKKAV